MADDENLSAEQNDKLAYFQEITHIESLEECKQILQAFEWNMESAVQNTFNDPTPIGPTTTTATSSSTSLDGIAGGSSSVGGLLGDHHLHHHGSFNSLNNMHESNSHADELNELFTRAIAAASTSSASSSSSSPSNRNRPAPPPPVQRRPPSYSPTSPNNNLPNVNVLQPRSLSYPAGGTGRLVAPPQGILGWSIFLVAFPFKFIMSTVYDLVAFFMTMFDHTPAIPHDYDPLANIAEFTIDFNQTFGINHPEFFPGSYSQAVNEAKRELRFLLVYIHEKDNADCTRFATETMLSTELSDYLSRSQFIVWACSHDLPEGRKVFAALKARRCPFLGVICLHNSRMSLVLRIEGPITTVDLTRQLASCVTENEAELVTARLDREQLTQNQLIRQQQDVAYEESLRMDREKAQRKREQEEAAKRERDAEKQKQEEEEARIKRIMDKKSEYRQILAETQQPDATSPSAIKLIVKLPTGNRFERVFLKTDALSELYKFVFSNEECPFNFEIVTNFPRKLIECDETTSMSIQDFGITQSMILFVNDLDA